MMHRRSTSTKSDRYGAAIVEMAVVMPIVMVIFYGLIEISRLLMLQHTADAAAYEGARQAIVPGATVDEGIAAARVLLDADKLKGTEVVVEPAEITEATSVVTVTVSIPTSSNTWLRFFSLGDFTISSEISLYCERPPVSLLTGTSDMKLKAKSAKGKSDKTAL